MDARPRRRRWCCHPKTTLFGERRRRQGRKEPSPRCRAPTFRERPRLASCMRARALALAGAAHAVNHRQGSEAACRARLRLTPFRRGLTSFPSPSRPAGCSSSRRVPSRGGPRLQAGRHLPVCRRPCERRPRTPDGRVVSFRSPSAADERDGAVLARDQHGRKEVDEILSRSGGERRHVLSRSALGK